MFLSENRINRRTLRPKTHTSDLVNRQKVAGIEEDTEDTTPRGSGEVQPTKWSS